MTLSPLERFPNPPILVTGAPRSGTTFVGAVLGRTPGVRFVYEPFNAQIGMTGVPQQFAYVTAGGRHEPAMTSAVESLLGGRARFHASTIDAPAPWPRRVVRTVLGSRTHLRYRRDVLRGGDRWLLKDPMAAFSAEWLHRRFDAATVVTVRHPVAVVHSYLRLGWSFGLEDLAAQPELLVDHGLHDLVGDGHGFDPVESAARLWAAVYTVVGHYLDRNAAMVAVRHEDLSRHPDAGFERLYRRVGLDYDVRAQDHVRDLTGTHNPAGPSSHRVHTLRRDSRADLGRWRGEVDRVDVETIRRVAGPVAARWYGDDDW